MNITEMQTNHINNPIGFAMDHPVFSWKVSEANNHQPVQARLRVWKENAQGSKEIKEIIYDSGWSDAIDSLGTPVYMELSPRTRYFWQVRILDEQENETISPEAFFETGKREEEWSGKWITCEEKSGRHPVFSVNFETEKPVRQARLYICGLGLYHAFLNGKKIGEEYLAPGCNAYDQWVQYQSFELDPEFLSRGKHELTVMLGDGWYKGRFGFDDEDGKGHYGDEWKLIAEMHIDYEDGSHQVIGSGEDWQVCAGPVTFSGIYDGEFRDDTLEPIFGKTKLAQAPEGKLEERRSLPVTIHEQFHPAEILLTPKGEKVLDLGQNFGGIFKLHVHVPKGQEVHLQFGEVLQDGCFYRDNLRSARAEYKYISDGKEKDLMPMFTFYGYRYVKIEGIDDLRPEDFTGLALYSDFEDRGTLKSGHPLVNQLISNVRWGLKSNFIDVPTDCPQRDERMGWTGDAQVFAPTATYLEDTWAFYQKYLYDMAMEQKKLNGKVPQVIPAFDQSGTSSVWGDAATLIPWTMYQFYGDPSILENQYEAMKSWVDWIAEIDKSEGWGNQFHYGDWLSLDHPDKRSDQCMGATDADFIAYIYYMQSAQIVSKSAGILQKTEDEENYRALAQALREQILNKYYTGTGRCAISTQCAMVLSLRHHLGDDDWSKNHLKELLAWNEDKLNTGFVGTPLLAPALSQAGMDNIAWNLLLNEEYPGWLYEVKLGATTIWERWNSINEDGSISSTGMNSLNHYAYGSILEWLFAYGAGIRQKEGTAGFRHALLAPSIQTELGFLEASYNSPAGEYVLNWYVMEDGKIKVQVQVPAGGQADLVLPGFNPDSQICLEASSPIFETINLDNPDVLCLEPGSYELIYTPEGSLGRHFNVDTRLEEILADAMAKEGLRQMVPQVDLLPPSFYHMTIRQILRTFSGMEGVPTGDNLDVLMEALDAGLAGLGQSA